MTSKIHLYYIPPKIHSPSLSVDTLGGIGLGKPLFTASQSWNGWKLWTDWLQSPHNLVCKWQSRQCMTAGSFLYFMQLVSLIQLFSSRYDGVEQALLKCCPAFISCSGSVPPILLWQLWCPLIFDQHIGCLQKVSQITSNWNKKLCLFKSIYP